MTLSKMNACLLAWTIRSQQQVAYEKQELALISSQVSGHFFGDGYVYLCAERDHYGPDLGRNKNAISKKS